MCNTVTQLSNRAGIPKGYNAFTSDLLHTDAVGLPKGATVKRLRHGNCVGGKNTPTYHVWQDMLKRCSNPNAQGYERWGGRGIKVCERWRKFENFLADMGQRPNAELSLDRIDNNGNYEPGNCRWATWEEQCSNRRDNRLLTVNGVTQTLTRWATQIGINPITLRTRIRRGWDHRDAVRRSIQIKRYNFTEPEITP